MANHSLPQTTSLYTNFVSELDARFDDLAVGLDPAATTATNLPTNSVRWNSANKYWEKFNGSTWSKLSSQYSIDINGTVGATTPATGAFTTLSTSGVAALASGATVGGNAVVTVSDAQTLTNKTLTSPTISSISNSGTIVLPTGNDTLIGRNTTDTLTNKTLTAPKFADLGYIADPSGNQLLVFDSVASATNELTVSNAATTGIPALSATGGDANISLNLVAKGTGTVQAGGVPIVTTTGTQTLTNKTLTSPTISTIANTGTLTLPTSTDTLVGRNTTDTLTNKTLTSPSLTGTPIAVTAADGTNSTQVATTAFVQSAVGGYLSKTSTGGTVTLTDAEASNPVIAFTGTLTSNLVVVLPTTINRLWAVYNNTSGAFTLTVKTSAGTGVVVTQGKRNLVYSNGTNVYDGVDDFESISLTGVPTAPTAAAGTNSTQIATTAFVQGEAATTATANKLVKRDANGYINAAAYNSTLADTTTAATHYYVETGSDGWLRPKPLANARSEIVTTAAVNSAAATTVGTITAGTWNGTDIEVAYGGTGASDAATARTNLGVPSLTGAGASGTWPISITGSASSVKSSTANPPTFQNTSGTEIGQLCRAWVNFNGVTTATIRASFNVSSVVRNGTGDYTVNFTNAMTDVNYSFSLQATGSAGGTGYQNASLYPTSALTTTSIRLLSKATGTVDADYVAVAIFR